MTGLTDLEITKLCAEAMGIDAVTIDGKIYDCTEDTFGIQYVPLHDDAQAMALVKRFELRIQHSADPGGAGWYAARDYGFRKAPDDGWSSDLNRAIVECVAKMQLSRTGKNEEAKA